VVVEARPSGVALKHIRAIGGYRNDDEILHGRVAPDLLGHLEAIHPGKTDIEEEDIGPTGSDGSQDLVTVMDGLHVETGESNEER
jgi:hypothetical protein